MLIKKKKKKVERDFKLVNILGAYASERECARVSEREKSFVLVFSPPKAVCISAFSTHLHNRVVSFYVAFIC